ncbi:hypothetical protein [Xanthomonas sp. MUS 060]|uniref:hypothetical protein n=1 Tax=Xanthomonas sp. MUS 060 TaxID=1588031 RepID=UPI0005F29DD0|nr:hypothetical protein [Xanthomonas sp. MUS 060]
MTRLLPILLLSLAGCGQVRPCVPLVQRVEVPAIAPSDLIDLTVPCRIKHAAEIDGNLISLAYDANIASLKECNERMRKIRQKLSAQSQSKR